MQTRQNSALRPKQEPRTHDNLLSSAREDAHAVHQRWEKRRSYKPSTGRHNPWGNYRRARPQRAGATESHLRRRRGAEENPTLLPCSGRARAMEQRLAEFREARKRAGLVAQPSTASQGEQPSAEKAVAAAATPKTAPSWLRRFLTWKASPAITRARPNQAQVRTEARTSKLRLRAGPRPTLLRTSHAHGLCSSKPFTILCALSPPAQRPNTPFPLDFFLPRHGPMQQLIAKRKRRSRGLAERSICLHA